MNTRDRVVDFYTESLGGIQMTLHPEAFTACDDHIEAHAEITCGGVGTGSYQWYLSYNGISYNSISGATSSNLYYAVDPDASTPDLFWFKCIATFSNGTASAHHFFFKHPCPPRLANPHVLVKDNLISSVSIIPNPANEALHLQIESSGKAVVEYQIFDLTGKKISNLKQLILREGKNNNLIDVKQFQAGSYYLKINGAACCSNIPFVIVH